MKETDEEDYDGAQNNNMEAYKANSWLKLSMRSFYSERK